MRLDRTRPTSEVLGGPCRLLEQDGHYFTPAGVHVDSSGHPLSDPEPPIDAPPPASADTYEGMDHRHLKVLMENYGEKYTTRESAIKFLRGRN